MPLTCQAAGAKAAGVITRKDVWFSIFNTALIRPFAGLFQASGFLYMACPCAHTPVPPAEQVLPWSPSCASA